MNRKVILTILDGRGLADIDQEHKSAIHLAKTPNFDAFWTKYPHSTLKTFGEHVGLPDGQMGNSEVGHMSIGSGRVIYQDLVKISKMMREGSFENIQVLQDIITQTKETNQPVHIIGLLSDGGVHSHISHIFGLIDILDSNGVQSLIHAITDGRDVDPKSGIIYIQQLLEYIKDKNAKLVDVIGRYYAMDRDNRRERIKLTTDLYTRGVGKATHDIIAEMQKNYDKGITDEFIKPIIYTPDFVQKDWNFDILETERLVIKPITIDDVDNIYNIGKDLEIQEYFDNPINQSKEEIETLISSEIEKYNNKEMISLSVLNKNGNLIGNTEIGNIKSGKPSLGIRLGKEFQGKGYGKEIIKTLINWIKDKINYDFIRRNCYEGNIGSKKIIESLGGKLITTFKNKNWKYGDINDCIYYIYNSDFVQKDWNFDILETERLTIKPVTMDDIYDIYNGASEEISEYYGRNLADTKRNLHIPNLIKEYENKENLPLVIRNKENNNFIGLIGLTELNSQNPELSLRITKNERSKGYGFESSKGLINRAFDNLNTNIYIKYKGFEKNAGTIKIIEKLGGVLKTQKNNKNWKYDNLIENTYYVYNPNKSEYISDIYNINEGSIAIMTNFRTDRGRELVDALTQYDHPEYDIYKIDNLTVATMTNYDDKFHNIQVLLPRDNLTETLGELISKADKKQIRIAETEKYPHVTFFFSGGQETEFPGEKRILVNSPKVATYDLQPEMSAIDITNKILPELESQESDFVALNFANTDMVGHTGDLSAAIRAAETVDKCLGQIVTTALKHNYDIIVIADHGNADIMFNDDQSPNTAHTLNLVPCIYISNDLSTAPFGTLKNGKLADVAPTILHLMGIEKPNSMDGKSLL